MSVASAGQTGQAAFRKTCVNFCVMFSSVGFFPSYASSQPPQETWFYLDQKKFRKSGQGRLTVKWGKTCVYRVVVIVVYALSFRLCVLGEWLNKAMFWVANLLVNRVGKGRLVDAKLCWVKKQRGDTGDHWEAIPDRELLQVQMPEAGPASFSSFVTCHSLPTFLTGGIVFFLTSLKLRSVINDL